VAATPPLVLIVEDDPDTRTLYRELLTVSGFRVAEAHNGFQALDKARELHPDAVITDIGVPGMDGFEFSRALRGSPDTRTIPILAITGHAEYLTEPARVRTAGINQVLAKPCPASRLVSELRHLLAPAARPLLIPKA
jgi:CheY-like chemotaxis protein